MKLRSFKRLRWVVDKTPTFLKWSYKVRWIKRGLDNYLKALVRTDFEFGTTYKYSQTNFALITANRGCPWDFAIRNRHKRWRAKNYNSEILFATEDYHILKMTKKYV